MNRNEKKNKHMTLEDRIEIQECLSKGMMFKHIAKRVGKSATTVSREVRNHAQTHRNGFVKTDEICPRLLKAPFVCNGCEMRSRNTCPYARRLYVAKKAQEAYEQVLSESRTGVALNRESFYETEQIISDAVDRGQHIYHAVTSNKLPVSMATVYRYISKGYYERVRRIDLPRAVKFKPRREQMPEHIPAWAKKGRTYGDYLDYVADHDGIPLSQTDTVIGRIGGKAILTFHSLIGDFMIGRLIDNKTAAEVSDKIRELKQHLKDCGFSFGDVYPVLLTDNGGEFSCVSAFENDLDGNLETHLFFCEPRSPEEKPEIEKNHTLFRDIVPGGTSFDDFTQEDIDLIFSHVNAVKRKQFNGKSAYDMFTFTYSVELADALGISYIAPKDVIQSPKLLKKRIDSFSL